MSEPFNDRWRDRIQVEIGISWRAAPDKHDTWRQWAFSPTGGITRVGQVMTNPRRHLPDVWGPGYLEEIGSSINAETCLKETLWVSRCFWLHGALRILGLDIGAGVFYRQRFDPNSPSTGDQS